MGIIADMIHNKVKFQKAITKSKKDVANLIVKAIDDAKVKYNNKNQVIVESYELLKKNKPVEDFVPDSEELKRQETKINELNSRLSELQNQNSQMEITIGNLLKFKENACKSKIFGRVRFAAKILFFPNNL